MAAVEQLARCWRGAAAAAKEVLEKADCGADSAAYHRTRKPAGWSEFT